jgi:hypothetical protein
LNHCCPFCSGSSPWAAGSTAPLFTIGFLWTSFIAYLAAGSNLSRAMETGNVIHPPLLTGNNSTLIRDIFFIPEFHILTGVVGKLIWDLERSPAFPFEKAGLTSLTTG